MYHKENIYHNKKKINLIKYNINQPSYLLIKKSLSILGDSENVEERLRRNALRYQDVESIHQEAALIWRATKSGCAPIYIFNTMHYSINYDIKDYFKHILNLALQNVDVVFTEIRVSGDYRKRISGEIPFDLYLLDRYITKKAISENKTLMELENIDIRKVAGVTSLEKTVEGELELLTSTDIETLDLITKEYLSGNWGNRFKYDQSVSNRNFLWMDRILDTSNNQLHSLVACGGHHSLGQYGLPNLLAFEGYEVEVLLPKSIPQSELYRLYKKKESDTKVVDSEQSHIAESQNETDYTHLDSMKHPK